MMDSIESMSFGQRKKIELARSIAKPADLLIWDEPLNLIDVDARELVEQAVLHDSPTLVFVEHDATFLDRVSTGWVELVPSGRDTKALRARRTGRGGGMLYHRRSP